MHQGNVIIIVLSLSRFDHPHVSRCKLLEDNGSSCRGHGVRRQIVDDQLQTCSIERVFSFCTAPCHHFQVFQSRLLDFSHELSSSQSPCIVKAFWQISRNGDCTNLGVTITVGIANSSIVVPSSFSFLWS
jgi:hypothetical protein